MPRNLEVTNITVTVHSNYSGPRYCVHCEHGGFCYHVWISKDGREIEPGIGREYPTIYKKPASHLREGDPGYFDCRYLDATKTFGKALIEAMLCQANEQGLFDRADQAQVDEQVRQVERAKEARKVGRMREQAVAMHAVLAKIAAYSKMKTENRAKEKSMRASVSTDELEELFAQNVADEIKAEDEFIDEANVILTRINSDKPQTYHNVFNAQGKEVKVTVPED